jgi:DNA-binding winged helix-turn-helix (wHTH) protein/pimeloyl-ACP methyl ester carboxylesterase
MRSDWQMAIRQYLNRGRKHGYIELRYTFANYAVDLERVEIHRDDEPVAVEPQVFDLLALLISNQDRVVGHDEIFERVWNGRFVSLSTLTSRINAARAALNDNGTEQRFIKTIPRKGYRFIGLAERNDATESEVRSGPSPGRAQQIQFCSTPDDTRIAYSLVGEGETVVKAGNWLNHLEHDWNSPVWSHLLKWMAGNWRLVRYDARGNGLSDWHVEDISFDAFVRDLETVVDAAGLEQFTLFGASQGCAVSIAYAVKHPERVKRLILYGGFSRGRRLRGTQEDIENADAMLTLMRTGWGQENPAFRQVFTSLFVPGGTPEQMQWFNDLQRKTTSPENAARIRYVSDILNVEALLMRVKAPTLVLHCRDDAIQPFQEGRLIAATIPDARFVGLEGKNHLILETDPGWPRFRQEVESFMAAPDPASKST